MDDFALNVPQPVLIVVLHRGVRAISISASMFLPRWFCEDEISGRQYYLFRFHKRIDCLWRNPDCLSHFSNISLED
jgi:hypothetical protein